MAKKKDEWTEEPWQPEENDWYQQARQSARALAERPAFSYDPGADPLYRAAREQYLRQGRRAMEDVMGRTAALSGGYASSYAQTQGAQAYEAQLTRLAELLPDYYENARSAYDRESAALKDSLSTALGLYDKDYQAWLDRQSARERQAAVEGKRRDGVVDARIAAAGGGIPARSGGKPRIGLLRGEAEIAAGNVESVVQRLIGANTYGFGGEGGAGAIRQDAAVEIAQAGGGDRRCQGIGLVAGQRGVFPRLAPVRGDLPLVGEKGSVCLQLEGETVSQVADGVAGRLDELDAALSQL